MANSKRKIKATKPVKQSNQPNEISIDIDKWLIPGSILIAGLMITIGVFLGIRSIGDTAILGVKTAETPAPTTSPISGNTSTNIDDDPVKGNKDSATIAIIEFSDYECPYCKLYSQQTYPQIIQNYVDSGKAIYVYRDYIAVPQHNPTAALEATAANCAQKLAGDAKYYEFHDYIFNNTSSNGAGVPNGKTGLIDRAVSMGMDRAQFTACLDDPTMAQEIAKDQTDAESAGQRGTPGFAIGKYNKETGAVEGYLVSGALPFSSFQDVIEQALAL